MPKVRFSTAVPPDLLVCTNGNFIVYVGKFVDGVPDKEFELIHISHLYEEVVTRQLGKIV